MTRKHIIKSPWAVALAALGALALSACGGGDGQTPQTSPDSPPLGSDPGSTMEQPPAGSAQEEPGIPPGQMPENDGSNLGNPGLGGQQQ